MSADVEMLPPRQNSEAAASSSRDSPPHQSLSPIDPDNDASRLARLTIGSEPSGEPSNGLITTDDVDGAPKSTKSKPLSTATAPAAGKSALGAAGAKPKSSKSNLARSPSPSPPPPARPPLQTIRLDIKLGGPDDYEVDISSLSKTTGQRPPTPVPAPKRDISDDSHSEGDDEGDGKNDKKKRKKKNLGQEYYDTNDPFIDDSELAQDERTYFAQTKQKGFYVSSGQVALVNKTPKKPKSKKPNIMAPSASVSAALSSASLPPSLVGPLAGPSTLRPPSPSAKKAKKEDGTRDSPIALYSDAEDEHHTQGLKRKSSASETILTSLSGADHAEGGSKKKRKTVEIQPFHPELEKALDQLREAIAKETWEVKGKFPPSLKPLLAQVALQAIILGEYDDNFFNLMPRLFPYNKFTMTKLIKRTVWREHTNLLIERQNVLLQELKALADEGFPKAKEEYDRSVLSWEKRQERAKAEAEAGGHSVEGTPAASDSQPTPKIPGSALAQRPSVEDADHENGEHEEHAGTGKGKDREPHPPAKRYRLTDTMKALIWQLVCLSNECCRIENEKNNLEGNNQVVSDQGVRKTLYQKIVAAFPEGWLSSGQISRDVSVMKKKYEKEVLENEA
ncbi:hypothetical protein BKA93DRAFT_886629 [Sparassis latifolia]|uniref:Ubinuclein middle domain-containing protein n=1 Tax=Sparassis crispa TaxID=139825 RepID=A0A401GXD8_9APHY|nr:predicted protein [Sparassis crispa]GBE86852.1 predicted protein [Sparassis crispa]